MKLSKMLEWCTTVKYEILGRESDFVIRYKGNTAYILFKGSESLKSELKWITCSKSASVVEPVSYLLRKYSILWCILQYKIKK